MKIQLSDHFTYKMLLRFVLPSIIMMVFTSIYGVVDGLFVSNFVGKTPFAAVNLVMPFIMVFGGIGFMFGTGGSALVAKTMGEGDKHRANQYFTMMIAATLICGVIISTLGVIFMEPISVFLGADAEMLPDCVLYGRIVLAFNTAYMLQNVFQSFLIAAEKPKLCGSRWRRALPTWRWTPCSWRCSTGAWRALPSPLASARSWAACCRWCTSCGPTAACCS